MEHEQIALNYVSFSSFDIQLNLMAMIMLTPYFVKSVF